MDWYNVLYLAIGGVLTALGGFFTQFYTDKCTTKNYIREKEDKEKAEIKLKKENFYVEVVSTLTMVIAEKDISKETRISLNNLRAKFLLLINQEWFDKFWDLVIKVLTTKNNNKFDIKVVESFYQELKIKLFEDC